MTVDQIAPWASLLAAVLSIGYVLVDGRRRRTTGGAGGDGSRAGSDGSASLASLADEHGDVIVVAVTMFFAAGLAHVLLRGTAYFYPVAFWGVAGFVVVIVALGEVTGTVELD